jgi:hypothetical protein
MFPQVWDLKEVVLNRSAQQKNWLAMVRPVCRVAFPWMNTRVLLHRAISPYPQPRGTLSRYLDASYGR